MKPKFSSLYLFSLGTTAALLSNASAVDGTWANPTANTHTLTYVSSGVYSSSATLAVGDEIRTSATAAGLNTNRIYYIVAVNGSNYTLSTTPGGAAMSSTSTAGTTVTSQGALSWNATASNNLQTGDSWTGGVVPDGTDAIATIGSNIASPVAINSSITLGKINFTSTGNELNLFSSNNGGTSLAGITFSTTSGTPSIDVTGTKLFRLGLSDATFGQGKLKVSGTQGLVLNVTNSTGGGSIRLEDIDWSGFTDGGSGRGTITIQQGIVQNTVSNSLGTGTSALNMVIGNSSTNGSLYLPEFQLGNSKDVTINNLDGTSNARIVGAGRTITIGAGNGSNTDFAGIIGQSSTGANSNLNLSKTGTGTQTITGTIVGTGATVAVSGGSLVLSGDNSYTGDTSVATGATLKIGNSNALGTTAGITTVNSGGTLDLNGQTISETLSVTGSGVSSAGALINSNTSTAAVLNSEITNGAGLTVGGAGDMTLQRLRSGGGPMTLTKVGSGTLTLGNSNTTTHMNLLAVDVTSASTVNFNTVSGTNYLVADRGVRISAGGTVKYTGTGNNMVQDTQEVIVSNGTFNMNGNSDTVGRLTIGDGTNNGVISGGSSSTLTVGGSYQAFAVGGASLSGGIEAMSGTVNVKLAGAVGLTKTTEGTVTLSQANTYTGATAIKAGAIALGLNGTISNDLVLGTSTPTVGTLDVTAKSSFSQANVSGNGTLNIGAGKTVTVTGALAPGFSPGTVNVTGNLALAASTSTSMEIGGSGGVAGTDSDYVNVTGTFTLDGLLAIVSYNGFDLTQSGSYNLFDASSFTGDFDGVSVAGNPLSFAADVWSGTYTGKTYTFSENTGVLTVVPEPRAALLGGLGLLALLRRRK